MTTIIVVLIGIGVVFIASSLDCTPIRETFTAIVTNQPIDWTGTKNCTSTLPGTTPSKITAPAGTAEAVGQAQQEAYGPAVVKPGTGKTCPPGYEYIIATGQCRKVGRF